VRWLGLSVLAALAVYFFWVGRHARSSSAARRNIRRHLGPEEGEDALRVRKWRLLARLSRRLENTKVARRLKKQLEDSGVPVRWDVLWRGWLASAVMLPAGACLLTGSLLAFPAALAAALSLPGAVLRLLAGSRRQKAREQCEALASDLALFLRSGVPVEDALSLCARSSGPPVTEAVARFQSKVAAGAGVDAALVELAAELDSRDLQLIAQAMATSHETGAEVSRIMDTIGEAVRERSAIRRELESQTVQGRMSGRVVAALPLIFLGLSALISRSTLAVLVGTTPGLIILGIAVVLNALGFLWIKKILNIKG